jgi:hypothetical protein
MIALFSENALAIRKKPKKNLLSVKKYGINILQKQMGL